MSDIGLRPATHDDVEAIARVWHDAWRDGHLGHVPPALLEQRGPDDFLRRVPQRIPTTTVAEAGSQVVGFVTVEHDEIEQLFVDHARRGTGLASLLLAHGERQIAERHATAWLSAVAGNARARRFYVREGWHDTGPIDYEAETSAGRMVVPSHRYEKRVRGV